MAKRKNLNSVSAPVSAPVSTPHDNPTPQAGGTLVASLAIINTCLSVLFAIGQGKIFPSPWVEWTPLKGDGKPDTKRAVEGVVDVNRVLKNTPIVKPYDKGVAASLLQSWLTNPPNEGVITDENGRSIPASHKLNSGLTIGQALVKKLLERKVKTFYHIKSFDWSGTDSNGNTVFGLGSDWVLFQKRWNESSGDWKTVQEQYGYYEWGQPVLSKANIIALYDKGVAAKYDLVEYIKIGRGKHAKVVVTTGFVLDLLES